MYKCKFDKGNILSFFYHHCKVKYIVFFIRQTCWDVLRYDAGVCCPSVCLTKACKCDTDWTVPARIIQLCTYTSYDKRTTPTDFQGQGLKVKDTRYTLLFNLVNIIQAEQFQQGLSNLVHILLMTGTQHRSGVKGQGNMLYIVVKPCKHDTDWTVPARTIKLSTHTSYDKKTTPIDCQGQGSKVKVTHYTLLLNIVNKIQTGLSQLGPSNLVHILLMTR